MAMVIDADECTVCGDCEPVCPTQAIARKRGVYVIDAAVCNECADADDDPRCLDVCPVDFCIQPLAA
ncbi:4Fe-4S binding protein [Plasticicumulans acidivorans]|uniref:4Fe-4S binding protein n=1 Tax=Plasticicumulans acidivorans TaxID=886464 RepID=A0A317MTE0_9GAMM|nr:4Fe-4S binding protein [Plasticicumulans acidivorans]PWV60988.1 4Fe-4S binding protein [Plasticicumulans acidivorans]